MIEFGHLSHLGLRRKLNEDTYYGDAALGLWLVADGMGGHDSGEVASALARDVIVREVRSGRALIEAIRRAHHEILDLSHAFGRRLPMGTTVVAVRITPTGQYELAWVGDSRAYLWDGHLRQATSDHSYVQELIARGRLSPDQARQHPQRNVVTKALGVTSSSELGIESLHGELKPGMQMLLCSDGLSGEVEDAVLAQALAQPGIGAQECVDQLVAAALDAGGNDNITVLLLRRL